MDSLNWLRGQGISGIKRQSSICLISVWKGNGGTQPRSKTFSILLHKWLWWKPFYRWPIWPGHPQSRPSQCSLSSYHPSWMETLQSGEALPLVLRQVILDQRQILVIVLRAVVGPYPNIFLVRLRIAKAMRIKVALSFFSFLITLRIKVTGENVHRRWPNQEKFKSICYRAWTAICPGAKSSIVFVQVHHKEVYCKRSPFVKNPLQDFLLWESGNNMNKSLSLCVGKELPSPPNCKRLQFLK